MIKTIFLILLGYTAVFASHNPVSPPTKKEIIDMIQYGREIAGFAYKTTPETQNEFRQLFPRMNDFSTGGLGTLVNKNDFHGKTGLLDGRDTQCGFVAQKNKTKEFIVAIRGTKKNAHDWGTNLNLEPHSGGLKGGPVGHTKIPSHDKKKMHKGFFRYAESIIDDIWTKLSGKIKNEYPNDIKNKGLENVKISVYGHSLGGRQHKLWL